MWWFGAVILGILIDYILVRGSDSVSHWFLGKYKFNITLNLYILYSCRSLWLFSRNDWVYVIVQALRIYMSNSLDFPTARNGKSELLWKQERHQTQHGGLMTWVQQPWDPCGGRREMTPESCPLTSTHAHLHTQTQYMNIFNIIKIL